MSLYYQDEHVTLYHGDSIEVLPSLDAPVAALLTDPPYFKVKDDEWDNQWGKAEDFLSWVGEWLDLCKPLLAPNGSVWVFASPALTSSVERVVAERFKVLNSIRWVKKAGWHERTELAAARRFLTPWEGIIFAEQFHDEWGDQCNALHREVFAPLGNYIKAERERAGWTRQSLATALDGYKNLDSAAANVANWELGKNLIGENDYRAIRAALNNGGGDYLRREWDYLRREWDERRRHFENIRRPFIVTDRALASDTWTYKPVAHYPGKHPCEKPVQMLEDMIRTSTRPGDLVLDPFAGSGSTLVAARNLGRRAVGIEKDERYCEQIARRLDQYALDFGGVS